MMGLRRRLSALTPAGWAITAVVAALLLFGAWRGLWWVFGGKEAVKANAGKVVAEEQAKAGTAAGQAAVNGTIERYEVHRTIDRTVVQSQERINNAWRGESVGNEVDAAGAAALCGMHDSLCRGNQAAQVR